MTMSDEVAVDIEEDIEVNTQPPAKRNELGMYSSSEKTKILSVQKWHRSHLQELVVPLS